MFALKNFSILLCFAVATTILTLSVTAASSAAVIEEKLNVLVFYESLCPDSKRFLQNQLGPNYDELGDFIDIKLVPFGNAKSVDDGKEFVCQHGPAECLGNLKQSCVINQTTNQTAQVKFVVCQMTTHWNDNDVKECSESVGLPSNIDNCVNTQLGTNLQLEAERITKLYQVTYVPTIVYDKVFNQDLQQNSLKDFRATVCNLLRTRGDISLDDEVCK
uniref:Gamma-interferon inducible lysosomal thiol reductase n=1 Tax=Glossina morsitans morsitans TaxID=37546 RepID=D3TM92_GLOMM